MMNKSDLKLVKVNNVKDKKMFIQLPWTLYKNDHHWVAPLIRDVKFKLDVKRHPYFDHAIAEFFLCILNQRVVGRIAVVINHRHNDFHNECTGFFGMFECIEDYAVAKLLFTAAKNWCIDRGMNRIIGPLNLSIDDECGFLIDNFNTDPVVMMPYNPPYYPEFCECYGFSKTKDLYAYYSNVSGDNTNSVSKDGIQMIKEENITVRPINSKDFDKEIEIFMNIYNNSFKEHWGFVPLTKREITQMAKDLQQIAELDLILILEVKGNPVAFYMAIPNINEILKKLEGKLGLIGMLKFLYYKRKITSVRVYLAGVKEAYRCKGFLSILHTQLIKNIRHLGYKWCEYSWTLEDNHAINSFLNNIGSHLYKKYRIFGLEI